MYWFKVEEIFNSFIVLLTIAFVLQVEPLLSRLRLVSFIQPNIKQILVKNTPLKISPLLEKVKQ